MFAQFIQSLYNQGMTIDQVYVLLGVMALLGIVALVIAISVLIWVLKKIFSARRQASLVIYQVRVPKFTSKGGKEGMTETGEPKSQQELAERIAIIETIFANIAGLRAQRGTRAYFGGRTDHLSFEIVMKDGLIYFYVAAPVQLATFVEQQIQAQLPEAVIDRVPDYNIFAPSGAVTGALLTFKKEYIFPIKTYRKLETDPIEVLTNTLSKLDPGSGAAIQYVIRSAKGEWHAWGSKTASKAHQGKKISEAMREAGGKNSLGKFFKYLVDFWNVGSSTKQEPEKKDTYHLTQMEQEIVKGIEEKAAKGGLDANIRIIVSAPTQEQAQLYLDNIVNSYAQFNIYEFGNALERTTIRTDRLVHDFIYRAFDEHHHILVNTEEMTSLFHFPLPHIDTPNIIWLQAKSAPAPVNTPREGLYLGDNVFRGVSTAVHIKREDRRRHMYIIGMTGTGKSKWMDSLVLQDIKNGEGVCFIDPHGDDVDLILSGIPQERAHDVILFDPADYDRPMGINMLEYNSNNPQEKIFAINEMLAIFDKLYDLKATGGPMFEQYMRNALMLIMDDPASGSTLLEVPRVLADEEFRAYKLSRCKTPVVKEFWEKEAQKAGGEASLANMVPYITSKLTPFIANDLIRPIISQQTSSLNFSEIMNTKKILLVKLSKGKIGDINANLLGMIIIGKILMAALGRGEIPEKQRNDFYLYIDEFQNFLTESINVILSEARKYRLCLTIAHQFLGQLTQKGGDDKTKKAIFGNVGTKVCFRIGVEDAQEMAKEFSPVFNEYDLMNCPAYHMFVKLMIDNANPAPFSMRAPFVEDTFTLNVERGNTMRQLSRMTYGRDRSLVEAEVQERIRAASMPRPATRKPNPLDELFGT